MCASETILTPVQSARLGTDAKKIKKEIFRFKNNKYEEFIRIDNCSSNSDNNTNGISENKKNNNSNNNNNNNNKTNDEDENCYVNSNDETTKNKHDLHQSIALLEDMDISLCIFKIGFGKGNSNPVTDSTSFFKPNKDQDQAGDDVTYTNGIVHSSKNFYFYFGFDFKFHLNFDFRPHFMVYYYLNVYTLANFISFLGIEDLLSQIKIRYYVKYLKH